VLVEQSLLVLMLDMSR